MPDSEWEARRDAAMRAMKAVGRITDASDTDERWDEVFAGWKGQTEWHVTSSSTADRWDWRARPGGSRMSIAATGLAPVIEAGGARVIVPEIADYEVRRELIRVGATAGLDRLSRLSARYSLLLINRPALLQAAELWAHVRTRSPPYRTPDGTRRRRHPGWAGLASIDTGDSPRRRRVMHVT